MIVVGPPGSRVKEVVRDMLFNKRVEPVELKLKDGTIINTMCSSSHIEVIIPDGIQSTRDVNILAAIDISKDNQPSLLTKHVSRQIVLWSAHRLSYDAQCALRRIMDDSENGSKIILCVSHLDSIIEPIMSRCIIKRCVKEEDILLKEWTALSGETSLPKIKIPTTPAEVVELVNGWKIPPAAILLEMTKRGMTLKDAAERCIGCARTYDAYMWILNEF